MTLKDQLNADLRDAMRSGEETRKTTLRLLLTAVRNAEIPAEGATASQRTDLDDDAVLNIVRREVKQRRDSIDAYTKATDDSIAAGWALAGDRDQILADADPSAITG